jgi:hypothetical protein
LNAEREAAMSVAILDSFEINTNQMVRRCQQMYSRDYGWSKLFKVKIKKKDRRQSFQVMATDKRKAPDDWIEAAVIDDTGLRGAYLASFSGVIPPETTTFREYKRKRNSDQNVKDIILQGETERIEFEGRTKAADLDNCQ